MKHPLDHQLIKAVFHHGFIGFALRTSAKFFSNYLIPW